MMPKSRGQKRVGEAFRAASGCPVEAEVPLSSVVDLSSMGAWMSAEDIWALQEQRFDFVLRASTGAPVLALEFDGPCHATEAKRRADLRKNRACYFARLPLRRFRPGDVQPHDQVALVDWVASRYVASSDRDDCVPGEDPTLWFDLSHPFPGSEKKASHLWRQYGVASNHLDSSEWEDAVATVRSSCGFELEYAGCLWGPYEDFTRWCTVRRELFRYESRVDGPGSRTRLCGFERTMLYDWALPVFPGSASIAPVPVRIDIGIPESVYLHHNIDGTSAEELTRGFLEYLLLTDAIKWAGENLPGSGRCSAVASRVAP